MKGHTIREWVCLQAPRNEIKNRFKLFVKTFVDHHGKSVYRDTIKFMCEGMAVDTGIQVTIQYTC